LRGDGRADLVADQAVVGRRNSRHAISFPATPVSYVTALTRRDTHGPPPPPPPPSPRMGPVGAAAALYLTLAAMCQRIPNRGLRYVLTVICLVIPFLVAYARLYRGMHHLHD